MPLAFSIGTRSEMQRTNHRTWGHEVKTIMGGNKIWKMFQKQRAGESTMNR